MAAITNIRHYLLQDEVGIARHLEDFISVPAFIYRLHHDNYLAISRSILKPLGVANKGIGFQTFLGRMHPADCMKVFSIYAQDVPLLMRHKQGEELPALRGFEFRMKDRNMRWRKGVVKLDIAGYDEFGRSDKLFGMFWLDDVPLNTLEDVYDKPVEEIFGKLLMDRINEVRLSFKRCSAKNAIVPPEISPRELEVIRGLAFGLSTREIAEQMGISFHTVESHRKHLLYKFKARNTVYMMVKASQLLPIHFWS